MIASDDGHVFCFGKTNSRTNSSVSKPQVDDRLAGSWEFSERLNRMIGFDEDQRRRGAKDAHPTSFRLLLDKTLGERMPAEKLAAHRGFFQAPRSGHRLVSTGKWETTFDEQDDLGVGTDCFLTHHCGATFLFTDAPFVGVYGGKVSLIPGADRAHDVLVSDFNPHPHFLADKTPNTVVYKRTLTRD